MTSPVPAPLSCDSLLETLATRPDWAQWGQPYWSQTLLLMAATAGARLGGDPKAAELALSALQPQGDELLIALSLAARCGSIEQMQRFIDLGADVCATGETLDAINTRQQKNDANLGMDTPSKGSVLVHFPVWEALRAGRPKAARWLLEEQHAVLPSNLALASTELLKWAPDSQMEATLAVRDLFFGALSERQTLLDWNNTVCSHLMSLWGEDRIARSFSAPAATPAEQLHELDSQRRVADTVYHWISRALSWGACLNPLNPTGSTALGWAVAHGDVELAQKLVDLGADPLTMQYADRAQRTFTSIELLTRSLDLQMIEWGLDHGFEPTSPEQWKALRDSVYSRATQGAQQSKGQDLSAWLEARERAIGEHQALATLLTPNTAPPANPAVMEGRPLANASSPRTTAPQRPSGLRSPRL